MAYENLKGTTSKSFKIGPNGVKLSSSAVERVNEKGEKTLVKCLVTDQILDDKPLEVAYVKQGDDIYDTFIQSSEIRKISYGSDGTISFILKDGGNITINQLLTSGDVVGPDSSTPDAIVVFEDSTGKKIKDSSRIISDSFTNDDTSQNNNGMNVPSIQAVVGYVGEVSEPLKQRLEGNL